METMECKLIDYREKDYYVYNHYDFLLKIMKVCKLHKCEEVVIDYKDNKEISKIFFKLNNKEKFYSELSNKNMYNFINYIKKILNVNVKENVFCEKKKINENFTYVFNLTLNGEKTKDGELINIKF